MIDFELTDDHRSAQQMARDVAHKYLKPHIAELDRAGKNDPEFIKRLKDAELLGVCIPQKYGGMGLDYISLGLVCEEMEYIDTSARVIFSVHIGLNSLTLLTWGNEMQKEKYLIPQAKGEKIGTFGLTEPAAGSPTRTHIQPTYSNGFPGFTPLEPVSATRLPPTRYGW